MSYILSVKEKLEKITELMQQNLWKAYRHQKEWYDRLVGAEEFQTGDQALVLLPIATK